MRSRIALVATRRNAAAPKVAQLAPPHFITRWPLFYQESLGCSEALSHHRIGSRIGENPSGAPKTRPDHSVIIQHRPVLVISPRHPHTSRSSLSMPQSPLASVAGPQNRREAHC
ncbi:hypothetical protein BD779DRAFT_692335 [Infundibulicybe gibba]|nr:hypothetical protein BD779DRAFT_692335 [Infundibulicybe gibba]